MQQMNLLMIDDEERFLKTTKSLIDKKVINTFTATNGSDAMDILDKEKIDVVILDVKMPGLDGIEVLKVIKKRYPLLEVILFTGHATAEFAVAGINLGAFDFLTKPCDITTLINKSLEAYEKSRTMAEKRQKRKEKRQGDLRPIGEI